MTLLKNDETKQFIIDHWAAVQPKDVNAEWNAESVTFTDDTAIVTCSFPGLMPNPRYVVVALKRVEQYMQSLGLVELEPEAQAEPEPEPKKDAPKKVTNSVTKKTTKE